MEVTSSQTKNPVKQDQFFPLQNLVPKENQLSLVPHGAAFTKKSWAVLAWLAVPIVSILIVFLTVRKHTPSRPLQIAMTSLVAGIVLTALGTEILTNISNVCDFQEKKHKGENVAAVLGGFIVATALMIGLRAEGIKKAKQEDKKDPTKEAKNQSSIDTIFLVSTSLEFLIKSFLIGLTFSADRVAAIPLIFSLALSTGPAIFSKILSYQSKSLKPQMLIMGLFMLMVVVGFIVGFAAFEALGGHNALETAVGKTLLSFAAVVFLWTSVEDGLRWVYSKEIKIIQIANKKCVVNNNLPASQKNMLLGTCMFFVGVLVMVMARWGHKCH